MDGRLEPSDDSLAAARLHVQALTERGLPREALLQALLEQYDGDQQPLSPGQRNDGPAAYNHQQHLMAAGRGHAPRLSVSTTNSASTSRSAMSAMSGMSTLSAASTISSVSSHSSRFSQTPCLGPSRQVLSTRAYWCTSCETKFIRKFDWKRHEDEFHERYKKYPCPDCNRVFWGSNTFNQHHKARHGCKTCPHADSVVKYMKKKRAWGCGFCAAFLPTMDRYYDHVSLHFEAGRTKAHWYHSNVIYGLLHQPGVYEAWKNLVAAHHGHLPRDQRPSFYWDVKTTGRAQGYLENESPGQLQDFLEFFNPARDDPQQVIQLAFEKAMLTDPAPKPQSELQQAVSPGQPQQQPLSPRGPSSSGLGPWTAGDQAHLPPKSPGENEFRVSAVPMPLFTEQPPSVPVSSEPLAVFTPIQTGVPLTPQPIPQPMPQVQPHLCQPQAQSQPQLQLQSQPLQQQAHQQAQQPRHQPPPPPPPPPQQQQHQQQIISTSQQQQPLPTPSIDLLSFMSNETFMSSASLNLYEDWNSIASTMVDDQFGSIPPQPGPMDWSTSTFPNNNGPGP